MQRERMAEVRPSLDILKYEQLPNFWLNGQIEPRKMCVPAFRWLVQVEQSGKDALATSAQTSP